MSLLQLIYGLSGTSIYDDYIKYTPPLQPETAGCVSGRNNAAVDGHEKTSLGVEGGQGITDYSFRIFILRAMRVRISMMMYRQPMVTKMADQPKVSFTQPKTLAWMAAPM